MEGIDALNSGLYFSAAQAAAAESAAQAKKQEKAAKAAKTKKSVFASALEKSQAEHQLKLEGMPPEIAGMSVEEAVVFLKDAADIAADKLKASPLSENFADYRKKVSQFMRYVVKHAYGTEQYARSGKNKMGRKLAPNTLVVVVDKKLDEIAQWLMHSHSDTLQMLAKVEEINGLLVDLMAT